MMARKLPYWAAVALIAAAYYGTAKVGLLAAVAHGVVSSAWPPAGLALAALVLWGVRLWPGVTIGAFLLNATSGVPLAGAAVLGVGNTLEALIGAALLLRVARFRPSLERLRDVLALVAAAALSTAVGATVGVGGLWLSGAIAAMPRPSLWFVWWSGDAIGILIIAPVLLAWIATPRVRIPAGRTLEAAALVLLLLGLTSLLFRTSFSYVYAIFPVVCWAAVRFGPRGAASATLLVSALAVWSTVRGLGPFVASTPTQNLALLQTFIVLLALTSLVLAALTAEREAAERAVTESESHYRLLFEHNPSPLWVFDPTTLAFLAVNDAAVSHYGYTRAEFLRMTLRDVRPPEELARLEAYVRTVDDGLLAAGEWRHRKKDGVIIDVEVTRHSLTFAGRPATLALMHDVTHRNATEDQLRQAQKMEAVGRLAGGVAHDFNNLLTVIFGSADLLLEETGADDPRRVGVEEIKQAAVRAAVLTRQLLAFSRRQLLEPQVLDLNAVVADVAGMLGRLIGENVRLRTVPAAELGTVRADRNQLEQVIMNLAVNARDAMPGGGELTIETANVELDDAYAGGHVPVAPGRYVMLVVSDTGAGMDAETKAHIFEPFFTTKPKGKGTGLGLATVFGIVKQSGGYIWVYSEPGAGTTFKVYLPRVDLAATVPAPKPVLTGSLGGSETILLAEDEAAVRDVVRRVLQIHGYTVLAAAGGPEAAEIAGAHKGPIHLLLTDVVMPDMSGRDLAEQLGAVRPAMKVLFLSGYTDDAIVHHGVLDPGIAFLQKPFTLHELARKLREVFDAPDVPGDV